MEDTVGLEALEAIGPTQQAHEWELTFSTQLATTQFLTQGTFVIRGHQARVNSVQQNRFKIRLHWVPYYVSNESFVDVFERNYVKVHSADFEKSSVEGLEHVRTLIRFFIVETDKPENIPHFISWNHGSLRGRALVTMTGRAPLCLRCKMSGHLRKQCSAPYCTTCRQYGHDSAVCQGATYASTTAATKGNVFHIDEELADVVDDFLKNDTIIRFRMI